MKTFFIEKRHIIIAVIAIAGIFSNLFLRFIPNPYSTYSVWPLGITLVLGGIPLVYELLIKLFKQEFGSDLLAGISIITSVILDEYLAGSLVVLMLSGGEALENYAIGHASSVLRALARRMPSIAHRKEKEAITDVALDQIAIGDILIIYPHDICPVDGRVIEGHGVMDESYLTGEPFQMSKTPGADVISGAINGESALTIEATKLPIDSRYAKIMKVMRASESQRPKIQRLGDQLGAYYTPLALVVAAAAWVATGDPDRFLAVIVVATPCPLLIGIPVAIIGTISLSAKRSIIVKNPTVLEQMDTCKTIIFDKTGTLTYGEPTLSEQFYIPDIDGREILALVASVERYSKHPLSRAILNVAKSEGMELREASEIREHPGEGLMGKVDGLTIQITSRKKIENEFSEIREKLPPMSGGLECLILCDQKFVALYRFRDEPRKEGVSFIHHLGPKHQFNRIMIVSGDRESEVRYLADRIGIREIFAGKSPEEKLTIVREETKKARTIYLGDGINDAPALMAATVGIAFGQNSDITSEAAGAVIIDSSLSRMDEFLHIGRRMRRIALQSAVGGIAFSLAGMIMAAFGYLPPVAGAITQEIIDVVVVLNALRCALPPKSLTDY